MQAPYTFEFQAMASRCELRLHAPDAATARAWADVAIAEVKRIEAKYSRYRDDSVTTAINRAAGGDAIMVDAETAGLIDFGAALHAQSGGRFDLTSGVLRLVWDFKAQKVPSQHAIDTVLPLIGWSQVEWHASRVRLPQRGMEIDFGGIGKEYAADRAGALLIESGVAHGLVNLGGDIRVLGPAPDGSPWRIAVQDPRGRPGATLARLDVAHGAMATSGDYERYFIAGGRRYCHVMDPRTGWPVDYWQSVSVVAPLAVAAGACATIAMLHPVGEALAFLQAQGVRYLAIDAGGGRHSA
ncbi:MAG TPA: FAD:protein FMN transferase [Burkholderiaceae bacterium]|nr:FAD:protein FMN transferase [Burkholderiaceae bacterium]HQR69405.1 FAD:protein FMN transferase [Burkholderiaceae bacterium]